MISNVVTQRSKRYVIRVPLQYHILGVRTWHRGVSHNISESGILFEGEALLAHGAQCEVRLVLPPADRKGKEALLSFRAIVVRCPRERLWAARIFNRRLKPVERNNETHVTMGKDRVCGNFLV